MHLFSALIRGAIVRHALGLLWPHVKQAHDVYGMILEQEESVGEQNPLPSQHIQLRFWV